MSRPTTWHELSSGAPDEVILAVDFDDPGRRAARFHDLIAQLHPGMTVWLTEPRLMALMPGEPAEAYVRQWASEVLVSGRRVRAILGVGTGGVYAGAIAEELHRLSGELPSTVLFDPRRPTLDDLYFRFHQAVLAIAPALSADQVSAAEVAALCAQDLDGDLADYALRLLEIFRTTSRIAVEWLDTEQRKLARFTATLRSFLAYTANAERIDPTVAWRHAIAIVSTARDRSGSVAPRPRSVLDPVAGELHFEVAHGDLLRTPAVASAVSRRVTGEPADRIAAPEHPA